MDTLLSRYRSIILLLVMLVGQLIFLAYQVKNENDVRLIRVAVVYVITPIAQIAEFTRSSIYGVFHNYFDLRNARDENRRMRSEIGKLKLQNQYLQTELNTADRVKALAAFEKQTPSRMLAARIVATATTSASKIVFLDRGSNSEVEKGMAVITPDGIVGKILAAYPTASQALLATDAGFSAGVVSQKNRVRGVLSGIGSGKCEVKYVQNEEKVEVGEMFFTSGDDRIFPRGLPVGKAAVVRDGSQFKEILVYPSGLQNGPEEVLIVLNGVHQLVPAYQDVAENQPVYLGKLPPTSKQGTNTPQPLATDADRLRERYLKIGAAEGHRFGEGNVPNFNVPLPSANKPAETPPSATTQAVAPAVPPNRPLANTPKPAPVAGNVNGPLPLDKQRPTQAPKPRTPPPVSPPPTSAPAAQQTSPDPQEKPVDSPQGQR